MTRQTEFEFKKRKRQAARAAKELLYPAELVERIESAKTEEEIAKALMEGRRRAR